MDALVHDNRRMASFTNLMFILVGGLFAIVGSLMGIREYSFGAQATTAKGAVVELRKTESADSTNFIPVIEFNTESQQKIRFEGMSTSPPYVVGTSVSVLYRTSNPNDARIDEFVQRWLFPSLFTPIGIVCLLIGLFSVMRPSSRQCDTEGIADDAFVDSDA